MLTFAHKNNKQIRNMWKEIMKEFFNQAIGENEYIFEDDDLIYNERNPKSGLDCWIRLDVNYDKKRNLVWKNLFQEFTLDENKEIIKNPNYTRPLKNSILTELFFDKVIISKDEEKAIKNMCRLCPSRKDMYEETIVEYNGTTYYIIWD